MDPEKRAQLGDPFGKDEPASWWPDVEARLAQRRSGRARRPVLAAVAVAAAGVLALGGAQALRRSPTPASTVALVAAPGPLTLAGASAPLVALPAPATVADSLRVELSDRSVIQSEGPAELRLLENDGAHFELKQLRGRVSYEVTPGGPRRWVVTCALATIEVVGTGFLVEAETARLRVRVEHGAVLVRGERVPERVQRLGAGDELVVLAGEGMTSGSSIPPAGSAPAGSASAPATASAAAPAAPSGGRAWRDLARKGAFKEAYAELGSDGLAGAVAQASTEELFALADVARFSGHPREAVAPLSKIAQRGGTQGALAAFTLGRVHLDQLGDASGAAQDFERAMALGLGGGLWEDAAVRRIEALARSGQKAQASEAAQRLIEQRPALEKRVAAWR